MNPITITDAALTQIRIELEKRSNTPDVYLRLGVRGSGCFGHEYVFIFDTKEKRDIDTEYDFGGVKVIIDNKSIKLLTGMTLDYKSTLMTQKFIFQNPNAQNLCGCGKSFATTK